MQNLSVTALNLSDLRTTYGGKYDGLSPFSIVDFSINRPAPRPIWVPGPDGRPIPVY